MLTRRLLAGLVFLSFSIPLNLLAARIEISDGSVIVGEVLQRSADSYTIRMQSGGQVQIDARNVVRIVDTQPQARPGEAAAAPALALRRSMLRFYGSNTVGEKLLPAIANAYVAAKGSRGTGWEPGARENERILQITNPSQGLPEEIHVKAHGSSTAFKALEIFEADVGMSSRPIKPTELIRLASLGDLTQPNSEHVLALDGLGVIVHPSNPVQALSKRQVARIFAGEVRDWSAVGGNRGAIQLYARDDNSGTYDTFKTLVLNSQGVSLSTAAKRFESSQRLSDFVATDPNAIGFIGWSYIRDAKAIDLKECDLAYSPSGFAIKTEEYPLARRLYLYTPATPESAHVEDFVDFARSTAGQEVIAESGFVDLSVESASEAEMEKFRLSRLLAALNSVQDLDVLKDFIETTHRATRLSVTFRFRTNSFQLDNRALADVERLNGYLESPEGSGKQLMLFGFADSVGDYGMNLALSRTRAQSVANELVRNGLRGALVVKGFGEEAAVACNDTSGGRYTNRRVEVWVK